MLTVDKIARVQQPFAVIAPIADDAAALFYRRLFELDPSLKAMFRGDMTEQRPRAPSSASAQVISSIELRPISPGKGAGGRRPPRPSSAGGANVVTTRP